MGQHKYNPNCQLAAEGKLPPKPKKMSKRQQERFLMKLIYEKMGIGAIERAVGINSYNAPFFPNCGTKMDLED